MQPFGFATATQIRFGDGTLAEIGALAAAFGNRALIVTSGKAARHQPLLDYLAQAGIETSVFSVSGEPDIATITEGVAQAQQQDMVIGFGGGSSIDAGKAIAALATNPGPVLDYLEVIGKSQPLQHAPLPYIAIPTTAGTGAEVTRNAVLESPEHRVKVSLRSPLMLPRIALVDPLLTHSLPASVTASTGMDALTQLIEPFVSNQANPLTDALCREGLQHASRSLRQVYADGQNASARTDMALASLFGGLALANAKLGAVHGFAGTLGGMYHAPHGTICAALLAPVMSMNIAHGDEGIRSRYAEIARILTQDADASAEDALLWVKETSRLFQIPGLASLGLKDADMGTIIEQSARSSSMKGNPITLTAEQLQSILEQAS